MIKKIESIFSCRKGGAVTVPDEEAAKIFAVLMSVVNLLDSPLVASKGDLQDCVEKGVERITISMEDLARVQTAFNKLTE